MRESAQATPRAGENAGVVFEPEHAAVDMADRRSKDPGAYDSRTEAGAWTTAAEIDKQYLDEAPASVNPDKSPGRTEDGAVTSSQYVREGRDARRRSGSGTGEGEASTGDCSMGGTARAEARGSSVAERRRTIDLDYHHPLEDYLGTWWMRRLLGFISRGRRNGRTIIEDVIHSYGNPAAPLGQRVLYWPLHRFIRRMKGTVTDEMFRLRVAEHRATVRGLVATARSVAEFGLTIPQRFSSPLLVVWNFTNLCNGNCRHCYQDSGHQALPDELSLEEKLDLVDQIAAQYVPMIAFAGGEPTLSKDLLPVLRRCQEHGIHTTIASNGTAITKKMAADLVEAGVKYAEISLDSVDPARHDAFRGQPGMWQRTVAGMRNVVAQDGLRLGIAMCIHQGNFHEVDDMLRFALDIGASCFAYFNFIPVGRGLKMVGGDLTPRQREQVLDKLNGWMQSGKIGVLSTAPQLGRVCLAHTSLDGLQACSHTGSGSGLKARVIAKYVGGCGAGRCYVAVEPDGTITPCVYLPHRVLGHIRRRRFIDIFRHNEFWDLLCDRDRRLHHCEVCEFKNYCGGCRARADAYYGALNAGDPGCAFNSKHWDELVRRGVAVQGEGQEARTELAPAGT